MGIDFSEANLLVPFSASFRHRELIEGIEGGRIQGHPLERKTNMRSQHHHPYRTLKEWHAGQREKRKTARWIPYSLRWEGGAFVRIIPQV
jgi:hypothetical protein